MVGMILVSTSKSAPLKGMKAQQAPIGELRARAIDLHTEPTCYSPAFVEFACCCCCLLAGRARQVSSRPAGRASIGTANCCFRADLQ